MAVAGASVAVLIGAAVSVAATAVVAVGTKLAGVGAVEVGGALAGAVGAAWQATPTSSSAANISGRLLRHKVGLRKHVLIIHQ